MWILYYNLLYGKLLFFFVRVVYMICLNNLYILIEIYKFFL